MTPDALKTELGIYFKKEVDRIAGEEVAAAQNRIEERVRAKSAEIAAKIVDHFTMQSFEREMVMTVRFPKIE